MSDKVKIGDLKVSELESYCFDTDCTKCLQAEHIKVIMCALAEFFVQGDTETLVDINH